MRIILCQTKAIFPLISCFKLSPTKSTQAKYLLVMWKCFYLFSRFCIICLLPYFEYWFLLSPLHHTLMTSLKFLIVAEDKCLVKNLFKQFFTAVVSDEFVKHCLNFCQALLWGLASEVALSVSIISQAQSKVSVPVTTPELAGKVWR